MAPAAGAVPTPVSTLPPATPRPADAETIGGPALASGGLVVPKDAPALPASLAARTWIVADLSSGQVLGACGPHVRHEPASVQKLLLTAALIDKLDRSQVVEVTQADLDFEPGSSAVGLVAGGRYSIETLWLGLLLVSGNDAANVLARLGGAGAGVPGGLQAMNDLAHQIGARDTHAVTPSGLDGAGQFTSAYDLALIARACLANEDFRRYALTWSAQIPPQPAQAQEGFQVQNQNLLISQYPGALGGKTGFTDAARHTYVGAAERNGRRLVVALLSAEAVPARAWQQGADLLDWGFNVPSTDTVGRLVQPGDLDPSPSVSPTAPRSTAAVSANRPGHDIPIGPIWATSALLILVMAIGLPTIALLRRLAQQPRRPVS